MRFHDLIFQRIQRTDTFLYSKANSDWLWLKVGESRTPASSPAQVVGSVWQEKRNLRLVGVCEPWALDELWRSLWHRRGWNWKAKLNCLNHSPSSLSLQLTSRVEGCRLSSQIAAAACNRITARCCRAHLPCTGAVILCQGLPELQEWEWQPILPCSSLEPFTWALLSSACCLTPISQLFHFTARVPAPKSSPGLFIPGILLSWPELLLPEGHSPAWTAAPAQLLAPAPSSCSLCETLHSVTARLQGLLSPRWSRALSCPHSQNQSLLQIQNLVIISNKLWTSGFYFEVHNSSVFLASASSQNIKRQSQDT